MNENSNTLITLLTRKELQEYIRTEYPFNLSILHKALKLKLELDPEYEVWVPFVYYKLLTHIKNKASSPVLKPHKVFISSKGSVCSLLTGSPVPLTVSPINSYWNIQGLRDEDDSSSILLHRALGCCFIPVKEDLGSSHPKDLQINHIDGDKTNYELDNLEWCTGKQNIQHAYDTGLKVSPTGRDHHGSKPVKGTVLLPEFEGYEFIIIGIEQYRLYGFDQSAVSKCCLGKSKKHKNCSWSFAVDRESSTLPVGVTDEIKKGILSATYRGRPTKMYKESN